VVVGLVDFWVKVGEDTRGIGGWRKKFRVEKSGVGRFFGG
jgi:hypothetical protein